MKAFRNTSISTNRIGVLLTFCLLTIVACDKGTDEKASEIVRPVKIFVVDVLGSNTKRSFPGIVEATDQSELAFRVAGEINELTIKAGQVVKKGQLLAALDSTEYKLVLEDRQSKYDLAKSQFERAEKLVATGTISQVDYDRVKNNFNIATSDLKTARNNVGYTELRAPFEGLIARVLVDNHQNVQAKETILILQSKGNVDVAFQVPESIVSRVNRGSARQFPPTVRFDARPDAEFQTRLTEFDTVADPSTQTYRAVVSLIPPKEFTVLPGMTATVTLDLSKMITSDANVIYVPVESIFTDEESDVENARRFAWKIDLESMTVHRAEVTVGNLTSHGLEITSGLSGGDRIAAAGVHFLHEGQKIKPWERERGL